jgi:hypothetical protein
MSVEYKGYSGPLPSLDFRRQVANEVMIPFVDAISGEFVSSGEVRTLGVANFTGKVVRTIESVAASGKNDSSVPKVTFDVAIDGVSIFTTKPVIAHVSGELSQHKTTFSEADDTGITTEVINQSSCEFAIGSILTWTAVYSGAANPTTKIKNPSIIVEVEPVDP